MIVQPLPSSDAQLQFLQHLQRLFEEGEFSATYKYALLLALAELAVELGSENGASLALPISRIAEKFADFYWPQTLPYSVGLQDSPSGILSQNFGKQAAVVRHLMEIRRTGISTLAEARRHPQWPSTLRNIERVVRDMPIRYLQNLAGSPLVFLYDPVVHNGILTLLPGVAFHLRRFQGFVQQLARAGWVTHVRKNGQNAPLVGQAADLENFIFGNSRANLSRVGEALRPIQNNQCFYCAESLKSATAVDHFIPWYRYPRDTALNFVLAHATCNANKRELLAGRQHLDRWLERNLHQGDMVLSSVESLGFVSETHVTSMIAHWAYQQAISQGGQAWLHGKRTEPITQDYLSAFS